MKADMTALKEQMASMMDAMLGIRQLMDNNMATAAAVSSAAEADPTLPATAHHPLPNVVGQERSTLGHISNPHLGYNRVAYPYGLPPNYTPPVMRDDAGHVPSPILEGEPPRQSDEVHEDRREYAQGDINFYPLVPVEGPAPNTLPQPNLMGEPRNLPAQPIFLSTEGSSPAAEEKRKLNLICHTLISSGDHCLMACNLHLTASRNLTPIVKQTVKFRDMSGVERKHYYAIRKVL